MLLPEDLKDLANPWHTEGITEIGSARPYCLKYEWTTRRTTDKRSHTLVWSVMNLNWIIMHNPLPSMFIGQSRLLQNYHDHLTKHLSDDLRKTTRRSPQADKYVCLCRLLQALSFPSSLDSRGSSNHVDTSVSGDCGTCHSSVTVTWSTQPL